MQRLLPRRMLPNLHVALTALLVVVVVVYPEGPRSIAIVVLVSWHHACKLQVLRNTMNTNNTFHRISCFWSFLSKYKKHNDDASRTL